MKELVIATNNQGKLNEIRALLHGVDILSLKDIGFSDEIAEPYNTFEENAYTKASTVYLFCGKNVLSDDSGICVSGLGNSPGVHSAYYSGKPRNDDKNNNKLLADLGDNEDRSAFYKAVLCLIWEGETRYFEGVCTGNIARSLNGNGGFGYDPLFIPDGYEESFGSLPATVKNTISHRAAAMSQLKSFIRSKI